MLKLNEDKTELIIFKAKHQVGINEELRLQLGKNIVSVASPVKNLGVYAISKACYYQIRNIGHIRRYIILDVCKTLAHALITSRLDYGNALPYALPSTLMTQLQKVQNSSARLVTRTNKIYNTSLELPALASGYI